MCVCLYECVCARGICLSAVTCVMRAHPLAGGGAGAVGLIARIPVTLSHTHTHTHTHTNTHTSNKTHPNTTTTTTQREYTHTCPHTEGVSARHPSLQLGPVAVALTPLHKNTLSHTHTHTHTHTHIAT